MWTYAQSNGQLHHNGRLIATGYSGRGEGRNNPALEHKRAVGPLPRGKWRIVGPPYNSANVGPFALKLEPVGHNAHGRTAFRIHGNNKANDASHGCLVLPRSVREKIWTSEDTHLEVVR